MPNQTKLEEIIEKYGITRYAFIEMLDPLFERHQRNVWYEKLMGRRKVSEHDIERIRFILKKLGIITEIKVISETKHKII